MPATSSIRRRTAEKSSSLLFVSSSALTRNAAYVAGIGMCSFNKFRHLEILSLRQVLNGRLSAREATKAARTHIPGLAMADPLTSSKRIAVRLGRRTSCQRIGSQATSGRLSLYERTRGQLRSNLGDHRDDARVPSDICDLTPKWEGH
jgi:hypothetical protein